MTNQQLYLAIGIPSLLIVLSWISNFVMVNGFNTRIEGLSAKLDRQYENFNNQVTTLLTTIHTVDVRVVKLEERK